MSPTVERISEMAELSRQVAFRKASWEDWARLILDVVSRILPWILYYRATGRSVPSALRKTAALPIVGGIFLWDISGIFYWTQQMVGIYNGPGFLSVNGLFTFAVMSFGILFAMGIVSAAGEWALKRIVPEWFHGRHDPKIIKNRPSYVVMRNIPLAA